MNSVQEEWQDCAAQTHVTAAVTAFSPEMNLGPVPLAHIVDEWSENATRAGVERLAFVSEGITVEADALDVDVPQAVRTFESIEPALQWARE